MLQSRWKRLAWLKVEKFWRKLFVVLLILIGLVFVAFMAINLYLIKNDKQILKMVQSEINNGIAGNLTIGETKSSGLKLFPSVALVLKDVTLTDSNYNQHKKVLLKADYVYCKVDLRTLFTTPKVNSVKIDGANIFLYTDSNGLSNTQILRPKEEPKDTSKKGNTPELESVEIVNSKLTIINEQKAKHFEFAIKKVNADVFTDTGAWRANLDVNVQLVHFNFNKPKGSFLQGKTITGQPTVIFNPEEMKLDMHRQRLALDDVPLELTTNFDFLPDTPLFHIAFTIPEIPYKEAITYLKPKAPKMLSSIDIKKPLSINGTITGQMAYKAIPVVDVHFNCEDNVLTIAEEDIEHVNFSGNFINELVKGQPRTDDNSAVLLSKFKAEWMSIPFTVDSLRIENLLQPMLIGLFKSQFNLNKLNEFLDNDFIKIHKGNADINLVYKAPISKTDTRPSEIIGRIHLTEAQLTYVPRQMTVNAPVIKIRGAGKDLYVDQLSLKTANSDLQLQGFMKDFLNLYYSDPTRIVMNWQVTGHQINLLDFQKLWVARGSGSAKTASSKPTKRRTQQSVQTLSKQLDNAMAQSTVLLDVKVQNLLFKQFKATNVKANVAMLPSGLRLNNASLYAANGKVAVSGHLMGNELHAEADVNSVNAPMFLQSFNNFGQKAVEHQNIEGSVSLQANVNARLTNDGDLVQRSLVGRLKVHVKDGAIKDFEPLVKVSKWVFKKRNLDYVTLTSPLNIDMAINKSKITLQPTMIETSAINLLVEGVYGLDGGSNLYIDVPLRSPKGDEYIEDLVERKERNLQGLVVHLKGTTGDDGNIKISLVGKNRKEKDKEKALEKKESE